MLQKPLAQAILTCCAFLDVPRRSLRLRSRLLSVGSARLLPLERLATWLGGVAGCDHGCLLARLEKEDRRGQRTRHAHLRGRQNLRRGRLFGQALRRRSAPGKIPRSEKASWLEAQARRSGEKVAGSEPAGAPGGNTAGEARVPEAGGRRGGQRLHGKQNAQAAGVEPKKRSVGASARDEFL